MWRTIQQNNYIRTLPNHEVHVGLLHLSLANTFPVENTFSQAYPSNHHLQSPAYLQIVDFLSNRSKNY